MSFTPATNFNGTAYFQYTASDGVNSSTATVKVEVGVTKSGSNKNDTWRGTKGDDLYQGLNGNDTINGGMGNDTLSGGKGNDSFIFNSFNQGVDTITDFSVKEDTLVFSAAGFGGNLVAGKVNSNLFTLGTAATSSSHRFIYDAGSGDLFYDNDGIGGNEQIKIAQLDSGLSLSNGDLLVS